MAQLCKVDAAIVCFSRGTSESIWASQILALDFPTKPAAKQNIHKINE